MGTPKRRGVSKVCLFCGEVDADEDVNGKLLSKAGITAHYFCMLFSSGLSQNGESEKQGLLGFLPGDITKEVRRGTRLRCSYCKKYGATIGCVQKSCKKNFHLGCGRANGAFHLYFDTFSSYCAEHQPQQKVPPDNDPNARCAMCIDEVKTAPCSESLRAPCCQKKWYHRTCIQNYSKSAGLHFFKCPLCNNKQEFQKEMMAFGIYIPDQDASWETEPNAFQELLERYQNCDAKICRCAEGRKYNREGSKWEILLCNACGSQGSHAACSYLTKYRKKNLCPSCFDIEMKAKALASPKSQAFKELQSQCATSPEQTKQNTSEYPGPSANNMKRKLSLKTSDSKKPRLSLGAKGHSSATKHSKKPRLSLDPKASSTVTKESCLNKMSVAATNDTNKKKKSKTLSNVKDSAKGSSIKMCQGSTFMDRYLKYKSSSSPSSSGESSVEETSGNTSILLSYLDKNQLMSAYDLKKMKKKQRNSQEGLQKRKRKQKETKVSPKAEQGHSQGLKKRLSDEKFQKKLDSWLNAPQTNKVKTISEQTLQYVDGKVVDIPAKIKDIPSENIETQEKKPIVIEWRGKHLFLRPSKVHLRDIKTYDKKQPRPKNLNIDMVDEKGNPEWDAELDVLSNIDTDVRVTRNMINSLDQLTTKSNAGRSRTKSKLSTPVRATEASDKEDHVVHVLSPSETSASCKNRELVSLDKVSPCKKEIMDRAGEPGRCSLGVQGSRVCWTDVHQELPPLEAVTSLKKRDTVNGMEIMDRAGEPGRCSLGRQGSRVCWTDVHQELPPLEAVTSLKKRDTVNGMERLTPSKEDSIHRNNESTCIDSPSKNLRIRKFSKMTQADICSVPQMESPLKEDSIQRYDKSTCIDSPSKNLRIRKFSSMTLADSCSLPQMESPLKEDSIQRYDKSTCIDSPSKNLRMRKFSSMTLADSCSGPQIESPLKESLHGSEKSKRFDSPSMNPELLNVSTTTSSGSLSSPQSESPFKGETSHRNKESQSTDSTSKLRLRNLSTMTSADTPSTQRESIIFKHDALNGSYTCILATRTEKRHDSLRMNSTSKTYSVAEDINKEELVHQHLAEIRGMSNNQILDCHHIKEHSPNIVTGASMFSHSLAKGSVSPSGNTRRFSLPTHSPDKNPHARKVLSPRDHGCNSPSNWKGDMKRTVPQCNDENRHPWRGFLLTGSPWPEPTTFLPNVSGVE